MTGPQPPYPPQPHPGWGYPQPPRKRRSRWLIIGAATGGGLIILIGLVTCAGIIAAADDATDTATPAPPPVAGEPASGQPAAPPDGGTALEGYGQHPEDVEITACRTSDGLGWLEAEVTVTNTSSKASTYSISVVVETEDGARLLAEGWAYVSHLEPGQVTVEQATTAIEAPADTPYRCRLVSARRSVS